MIEIDTFEHAGLTVRIAAEEYIDDNDNPRKNCDGNIGVMFCEHSGYDLGDDDAEDPRSQTATCSACKGEGEVEASQENPCPNCGGPEGYPSQHAVGCPYRHGRGHVPCPKCEGVGEVELSITDYLKSIGCRVALPLFLYDHSGITMSCGGNLLADEDNMVSRGRFTGDAAGWDTSSVGLIYHSPELCERWGRPDTDDDKIKAELEEEVKTYATYLEGGVYRYEILDSEGEVLDSCGGFLDADIYKDDCYTKQEARSAAEAERRALDSEEVEALEMACRGIATVAD